MGENKRTKWVAGIVILLLFALIAVLLCMRPWESAEQPSESSSSVVLTTEQQRQLLLNAGMSDGQIAAFLDAKERVTKNTDAIADCEFWENKNAFYIATSGVRLYKMNSDGFSLPNTLAFTVSFDGDQIEKLVDFNDVPVIENGVLDTNYRPWTPEVILAAEAELEKALVPYAEKWYNEVWRPKKFSTSEWIKVKEVVLSQNDFKEQALYSDNFIAVNGKQLIILCQPTVICDIELMEGLPTFGSPQVYGTFEQRGGDAPELVKIGYSETLNYKNTVIYLEK